MPSVSLIIGSRSDEEVGDEIREVLEELGIDVEYKVISAHRHPDALDEYLRKSDAEIFITVAGLSAALPGVVASRTLRPVIGVPRSAMLGGLDALLSMAQMPGGVPVACVGVDNGENAALLAARMLALKYPGLEGRIREYVTSKGGPEDIS